MIFAVYTQGDYEMRVFIERNALETRRCQFGVNRYKTAYFFPFHCSIEKRSKRSIGFGRDDASIFKLMCKTKTNRRLSRVILNVSKIFRRSVSRFEPCEISLFFSTL